MNKIENFIENLESPLLNSVVFPDGRITLIDIDVEWSPETKYSIGVKEESSIDILESENDLNWSDCAVMVQLIDEEESIEVIAGEGDYGDDGFVGVIDLQTRKLIWLAFFNCSNPFNELDIQGDEIQAKSTLGCLWRFKIKKPIDFSVEC